MNMTDRQPVVVLYSNLSGYFLACLKEFVARSGRDVHVVRNQKDKNSPFVFKADQKIFFYDRADYDTGQLQQLVLSLDPVATFVSGWGDAGYKKTALALRKKGKAVICGMDNQWKATLRQKIATILSPFLIKRYFTHLWIPGRFQYEYARRLGFPRDRILMGVYCADVPKFQQESLTDTPVKRFLYVGRMIPIKGVIELIELAKRFAAEGITDWTFDLIGKGEEAEKFPDLPNLRHRDFMQPEQLAEEVKAGGVLILPSRSDAWGVVVHEFAVAGFPLLLSSAVGGIDGFLREGWNGFTYKVGDADELYHAARRFCDIDTETRVKMGQRSVQLGNAIEPGIWASTLIETIRSWSKPHGK